MLPSNLHFTLDVPHCGSHPYTLFAWNSSLEGSIDAQEQDLGSFGRASAAQLAQHQHMGHAKSGERECLTVTLTRGGKLGGPIRHSNSQEFTLELAPHCKSASE